MPRVNQMINLGHAYLTAGTNPMIQINNEEALTVLIEPGTRTVDIVHGFNRSPHTLYVKVLTLKKGKGDKTLWHSAYNMTRVNDNTARITFPRTLKRSATIVLSHQPIWSI